MLKRKHKVYKPEIRLAWDIFLCVQDKKKFYALYEKSHSVPPSHVLRAIHSIIQIMPIFRWSWGGSICYPENTLLCVIFFAL